MTSSQQSTNQVIMIEPKSFLANPQTAKTNAHQVLDDTPVGDLQALAQNEHRALVAKMRSHNIGVDCFEGQNETPDDLFCNNWVSFHGSQHVLYPMCAPNRRIERRLDLCERFKEKYGKAIDLTSFENENVFLESTGSMVLDRVAKKAYAAISARTDRSLFSKWCELLGYEGISFNWKYPNGGSVYHTNVVMYIGSQIAGICLEGIRSQDRERVRKHLEQSHEILDLSYEQINNYAGNALELQTLDGEAILLMSTCAYKALTKQQVNRLSKHYTHLLHSPIATIEKYGGGSVRCLLLECF